MPKINSKLKMCLLEWSYVLVFLLFLAIDQGEHIGLFFVTMAVMMVLINSAQKKYAKSLNSKNTNGDDDDSSFDPLDIRNTSGFTNPASPIHHSFD